MSYKLQSIRYQVRPMKLTRRTRSNIFKELTASPAITFKSCDKAKNGYFSFHDLDDLLSHIIIKWQWITWLRRLLIVIILSCRDTFSLSSERRETHWMPFKLVFSWRLHRWCFASPRMLDNWVKLIDLTWVLLANCDIRRKNRKSIGCDLISHLEIWWVVFICTQHKRDSYHSTVSQIRHQIPLYHPSATLYGIGSVICCLIRNYLIYRTIWG